MCRNHLQCGRALLKYNIPLFCPILPPRFKDINTGSRAIPSDNAATPLRPRSMPFISRSWLNTTNRLALVLLMSFTVTATMRCFVQVLSPEFTAFRARLSSVCRYSNSGGYFLFVASTRISHTTTQLSFSVLLFQSYTTTTYGASGGRSTASGSSFNSSARLRASASALRFAKISASFSLMYNIPKSERVIQSTLCVLRVVS